MTAVFIVRSVLATVLIAAGAAKLADLSSLTSTLKELTNGRVRRAAPLAAAIASCELSLGLLSYASVWRQAVDVTILGLTFGFVGTTAYAAARRPTLRCRCFGTLSQSRFDMKALLRTLTLAVSAALVVATWSAWSDVANSPTASFLIVIVGGVFALTVIQATRALDLVRNSPTTPPLTQGYR